MYYHLFKTQTQNKMTRMVLHTNELHAVCICTLPLLCLSLHFQNMTSGLWPTQYPDNACSLHPYVITHFVNISPHSFTKGGNLVYVFCLFQDSVLL